MITIVGINHTEKFENQLLKIIKNINPDVIFLELDRLNFKLLREELSQKEIKSYFSSMPSTFKLLSMYKAKSKNDKFVDRMWDSKFVLKLSKNFGFEIIPIDMDKKELYEQIELEIGFSEKFRILRSVIKKLFFKNSKMDNSKEYVQRFPTLNKYLIEKRSKYMANEIIKNARSFNDILVLVGNNHLESFKKLIVHDDKKIISLDEFRNI